MLHGEEDDAPVALAYGMTGGITLFVGLGGISLVIGEILLVQVCLHSRGVLESYSWKCSS